MELTTLREGLFFSVRLFFSLPLWREREIWLSEKLVCCVKATALCWLGSRSEAGLSFYVRTHTKVY